MRSKFRIFTDSVSAAKFRAAIACIALLFVFARTVMADGCFVFRWDKETDINEPAQKAVIVHDAGRGDLLLQVKYEGPLEEFGWLIPGPSYPVKGEQWWTANKNSLVHKDRLR